MPRSIHLAATLFVSLLVLALSSASAMAFQGHGYSASFGPEGVGSGTFGQVKSVAVDKSNGDVYVFDQGKAAIYKFTAAGAPADFSASGTNAIEDVAGPGGGAEQQIAVDSSSGPDKGDIYLANNEVVDIYSSAGTKLGELVEGKEACGVTVDPSGAVYVGFYPGTVKKYVPTTNPVTIASYTESLTGLKGICNISVDGEGDVYAATYSGGVRKYAASQFNTTETAAVTTPPESIFDEFGTTLVADTSDNNVYTDEGAVLLQRSSSGVLLSRLGESEPNALSGSYGVAINASTGTSASGDIYVSNGSGVVDIYTPATDPTTHTDAADGIVGSTATLHGDVEDPSSVPGGVDYYFSYNQGSRCFGPGSIKSTLNNGGANAMGNGDVHEEDVVSGLRAFTQYTACFVTVPADGSAVYGQSVQFTSAPAAPLVESETTSALGSRTVTLAAQVNPQKEKATCVFQYVSASEFGKSEYKNSKSIPCEPVDLGEGEEPVPVIARISGLEPETLYHFRAVAANQTGETPGADETFTTLVPMLASVETESASGIEATGATFGAQILNPSREETTCDVQYVTAQEFASSEYSSPKTVPCAPASLAAGESELLVSGSFTGLEPATVYHYRIEATNGAGTAVGEDQTLTTLPLPPEVSTGQATATSSTREAISGTVNPLGNDIWETTYEIQFGLTTAYGSRLEGQAGTGSSAVSVSGVAAELSPGTYHYRVIAKNAGGESSGPDATFEVSGAAPLVGPASAQFVNEHGAVIEGELNPGGEQTTYEVQYGSSAAYGASSAPIELAPFTSAQGTITAIVGLAPGTTYHYRIVATNAEGTVAGPDETFTTTGAALATTFTSFTIPSVALIPPIPFTFPREQPGTSTVVRGLTNKQKLAAALKACGKKKARQRNRCEKQAHSKYGPSPKTKQKKK
jgi:hypothetical protein